MEKENHGCGGAVVIYLVCTCIVEVLLQWMDSSKSAEHQQNESFWLISAFIAFFIALFLWVNVYEPYRKAQAESLQQRINARARKKEEEEEKKRKKKEREEIDEEKERNFKETGFKETDAERREREIQNAIDKRRQQTETLIKEVKAALKPLKKPEFNLYSKLLREHSVVIDNEDPEILHKLIRLKNYIESETKEIVKLKDDWCVLRKLKTGKISSVFDQLLEETKVYDQLLEETKEQSNFIVERYQYINRLIVFGCMMVQALKDDDKFLFFDIYEKLDSLGILQNTWEKQVKDGLDNIGDKLDRTNTKLEQLMYVLKEVEGNITAELQTLETSLATEISRLDDSVSGIGDGIEGINSKLSYSNVLNTYNTYQLYRIRKG